MARAEFREEERKDLYLYVDEFHNLVTDSFMNLFSEARKYGVCITVANQFMAQLVPRVLASVLGNIGTLAVFRVGGDDAAKLESEMTPVFKAKDMINLGMQEFYIKMTIDGSAHDPFSAETLKVLPATHQSYRDNIIGQSRAKYAIHIDAAKEAFHAEEDKHLERQRSGSGGHQREQDAEDQSEPFV